MRKEHFILPSNAIYLCGHSLGPMSKVAQKSVHETLSQWGSEAVKAWNTAHWIDASKQVSAKIAAFIGAAENEVTLCDSTSVNLFKVLMSALRLNSARKVILTTDDSFPADIYIAQGITVFQESVQLKTVPFEVLYEHLDEQVAVLMLTHVNYRDASVYDMEAITKKAHQFGILVIWDLSHSVGAVSLNLNAYEVDFAVGCTYKYLNGGPGSPAFLYVNACHHEHMETPIQGWMGHQNPFDFDLQYRSIGVSKYLGGTPSILSLKALEGALEIFESIEQAHLYTLSMEYSDFLIRGLEALGLQVVSPKNQRRGGHVALMHDEAYGLSRALIAEGVIVDYRAPRLIRLCVNPLYLTLEDLKVCIQQIQRILETQIYTQSDLVLG